MNKKSLIALPDKRLRQKSAKIKSIDTSVLQLAETMKQITLDWEKGRKHEVGIALAAVQAGKLSRVIIIRKNPDDKQSSEFEVFINPEITKYEGVVEEDFEGCLSIKDIYGKVPRHSKIRVKATNLSGQEFRMKAEGFLARILQHEIDHTNGTVFIDHIKNNPGAFLKLDEEGRLKKLDYEKEVKNNQKLW